jgi:hypothetical protein
MLLRMEAVDVELDAMRNAGPPRSYEHLSADQPLVTLVNELSRRSDRGFVFVQKGELSVTLGRD